MSKERPILFNDEMVRAILEGRKTQTRRVVKGIDHDLLDMMSEDIESGAPNSEMLELLYGPSTDDDGKPIPDQWLVRCTECPEEGVLTLGQGYGRPGDRLWVRETFSDVNLQGAPGIAYRADDNIRDLMAEPSFQDEDGAFNYSDERVKPYHFAAWSEDLLSGSEGRWRPSIHMPRWASRITLEITDVRAERLQDISAEDARAEGCGKPVLPPEVRGVAGDFVADERTTFAILWNRINGRDAWRANPWVWCISFQRIEQ